MTRQVRVCREGTWLYDGAVPAPVRVIALNWDHFREEDDPDPPYLNAAGWAYAVQFGAPGSAGAGGGSGTESMPSGTRGCRR
jgi:hypothetical protein